MRVVVTGGAGFIGSHTTLELLSQSHEVLVIDNHCNSSPKVLDRLKMLCNHDVDAVNQDLSDRDAVLGILRAFKPHAVVHFAGLKAVGESSTNPVLYYRENLNSSLSLLEAMEAAGCENLVYSSSATVYGNPEYLPLDEAHRCAPESPYGRTKHFSEMMFADWCAARPGARVMALRYFNPVGAHISGMIGEDPTGIPNNLMPFITQVAVGRRSELTVFGNDYETRDGTGVRDYIHVTDLAQAHVAALSSITKIDGFDAVNLGTGKGASVLDVVAAFERVSGQAIPYKFAPRRAGDVAACWADPRKAQQLLNWEAKLDLNAMCASAWQWQQQNPNGFS